MSFIIVQKLWNYCNVLRYNAMTYDNILSAEQVT